MYLPRFLEEKDHLDAKRWLYPVCSKTAESTSFAVVDSENNLVAGGLLPIFNSIFTAEALAILKACHIASINAELYVVCTDSLSVLLATLNPEHSYPTTEKLKKLLPITKSSRSSGSLAIKASLEMITPMQLQIICVLHPLSCLCQPMLKT